MSSEKTLPDVVAKWARRFCGCLYPEAPWQAILDMLRLFADKDRPYEEVTDNPNWHFVLHVLNCLDPELLEHGGGVGASWLTPAGEEMLLFLKEHGPDWADQEGVEWIDSDGVHYEHCWG